MTRIESRPDVMMGKPVVTWTRVTVEGIIDQIAEGEKIVADENLDRGIMTAYGVAVARILCYETFCQ